MRGGKGARLVFSRQLGLRTCSTFKRPGHKIMLFGKYFSERSFEHSSSLFYLRKCGGRRSLPSDTSAFMKTSNKYFSRLSAGQIWRIRWNRWTKRKDEKRKRWLGICLGFGQNWLEFREKRRMWFIRHWHLGLEKES